MIVECNKHALGFKRKNHQAFKTIISVYFDFGWIKLTQICI